MTKISRKAATLTEGLNVAAVAITISHPMMLSNMDSAPKGRRGTTRHPTAIGTYGKAMSKSCDANVSSEPATLYTLERHCSTDHRVQ